MPLFKLFDDPEEEESLPPSLQTDGLVCSRRLWLKYHHVRMAEDLQWKQMTFALKNHLDDEWVHDWRFELRLPSGTRIDAWIPDEHVFIEFKTGRPHATHLYQVWMMMAELDRFGIKGWEFQLWYPGRWQEQADELAETMQYESAQNAAGFAAMAVHEMDDSFPSRKQRDGGVLMGTVEQPEPPPVKSRDKSPCRDCSFFEFCHL